jgi:hypothetical protein
VSNFSNYVFVLDDARRPLSPCSPARARQLLREGKAAVFRRYPFTIILKREIDDAKPMPVTVKIDPGSRTTGSGSSSASPLGGNKTGQLVCYITRTTHLLTGRANKINSLVICLYRGRKRQLPHSYHRNRNWRA